MGKYKVGDEVLVRAKITGGSRRKFGVDIEENCFDVCEENIVAVPGMTDEEAWEIALKLYELRNEKLTEIFGYANPYVIMRDFSPKEAKDKIEAWEAEEEIEAGDVVIETSDAGNEYIGCVTRITSAQDYVRIIYPDGSTNITLTKKLKKTGRHIDTKGILNQIGGSDA